MSSFQGSLFEIKAIPPSRNPRITTGRRSSLLAWKRYDKPQDEDVDLDERILAEALDLMTGLKALTLTRMDLDTRSVRIFKTIIAPRVQLHYLKIGDPVYESTFLVWNFAQTLATSQVFRLIIFQSELRTLILPFLETLRDNRLVLSASHIPVLNTLTAGVLAARLIVPGRPIKSLSLLELPHTDIDATWDAFASSEGPISELSLVVTRSHLLADNLRSIVEHLPHVTSLRLAGIRDKDYTAVSHSQHLSSGRNILTMSLHR